MTDPCQIEPGRVTVPTICVNDLQLESGEPHEPPIGFGDGSLRISWNMEIREASQEQADPRPFKHVLVESTARFGVIAMVKVITEESDGRVSFTRYVLPPSSRAQLLIWLHQLTAASPPHPAEYEPKPTNAQILVRGDNLLIESDRQLQARHTFKNGRRFGYRHPGYVRHFRIAGWAITNESGGPIAENNDPFGRPFSHVGANSYSIYVYFHD